MELQSGFGNEFATEALPDTLPQGRNSPPRPAPGRYAEQLSATPITVPRSEARRTWLYRIRPTVAHIGRFRPVDAGHWVSAPGPVATLPIQPLQPQPAAPVPSVANPPLVPIQR